MLFFQAILNKINNNLLCNKFYKINKNMTKEKKRRLYNIYNILYVSEDKKKNCVECTLLGSFDRSAVSLSNLKIILNYTVLYDILRIIFNVISLLC